jgi:lipopolysaccharide/colanic/teichoic acid biosynthesis glycosyltransferase
MTPGDKICLSTGLVVVDLCSVSAAMALAYHLRILGALFPYNAVAEFEPYIHAASLAMPLWLIIFAFSGLYSWHTTTLGRAIEIGLVTKASTFGVIGLILVSFIERRALLSRGWILLTWVLSICLVSGGRTLFRAGIARMRRHGRFRSRVLIIGANDRALMIARRLAGDLESGSEIVGFLDEYQPAGSSVEGRFIILGHPSEMERFVKESAADEVVVVPDALTWEGYHDIVRHNVVTQTETVVRLSPGIYEILTTGLKLSDIAGVPLLTLEGIRITGFGALIKTITDYSFGAACMLLAAPVMAVVALAIWLTGAPRVFDRYRVIGLRGKEFETIKFHTGLLNSSRRSLRMPGSRPPAGRVPITAVGAFLYRTGMDKLPQLFNVLRGEMSLVGPRTISVSDSADYERWLPDLLTVRPGVTGPWAVSTDASLQDELSEALYYIRSWSPAADISIVLKTVGGILRRRVRQDLAVARVENLAKAEVYSASATETK